MKELSDLNFPGDLKYFEDHEWVESQGDSLRIGISDYAQDQLGDIVYVDLPQVGDRFNQGEEFGSVESVKAVSELFMPIGGEILAVNSDLEESPGLVNEDPYNKGWIIAVKPGDPSELDTLMDSNAYLDMLKGL